MALLQAMVWKWAAHPDEHALLRVIALSAVWFPLVAFAWRRFQRMRLSVYQFHEKMEARSHVGASQSLEPVDDLRLFYLVKLGFRALRLHAQAVRGLTKDPTIPPRLHVRTAIYGTLGGIGTLALIRGLGVYHAYPWDVLNFGLGASGIAVLTELVRFITAAIYYYHDVQKTGIDPLHPDQYGGFGVVAEDGHALVMWLLLLMTFGNLYFLTHLAIDETPRVRLPSYLLSFTVSWHDVANWLSIFCSGIVLATYLFVHLALLDLFTRNRTAAIAVADHAYHDAHFEPQRIVLKAAMEMKTAPANLPQSAQTLALAFGALAALLTNLHNAGVVDAGPISALLNAWADGK
jgi:hypothetical protein